MAVGSSTHVVTLHIRSHAESSSTGRLSCSLKPCFLLASVMQRFSSQLHLHDNEGRLLARALRALCAVQCYKHVLALCYVKILAWMLGCGGELQFLVPWVAFFLVWETLWWLRAQLRPREVRGQTREKATWRRILLPKRSWLLVEKMKKLNYWLCYAGFIYQCTAVYSSTQRDRCIFLNLKNNMCMLAKLPQSCPTLCHPMDGSLPVSFVHGIFQAILEWVKNNTSITES